MTPKGKRMASVILAVLLGFAIPPLLFCLLYAIIWIVGAWYDR